MSKIFLNCDLLGARRSEGMKINVAIFTEKGTCLRESTSFDFKPFCVQVGWGEGLTHRAEVEEFRKSRDSHMYEMSPLAYSWWRSIVVRPPA